MSGKPHFVGEIISSGPDLEVRGHYVNNFRRPCAFSINVDQKSSVDEARGVVLQGDRFEVWHKLAAIAEVAWNLGWRPGSLVGAVDNVVKNHKLPNMTKIGNNISMTEPPPPPPAGQPSRRKTTSKGT
ncbi:MAG: hypothetical protein GY906_23220 [bacterium]|nr:hypothetical protein [bacterium]